MNGYLETFFWVVTIYLIATSVVHLIKVLKSRKEGESNTSLIKAVVYVAGGITIALLLLRKPFSISKLSKIMRPRPSATTDASVIITTSMSGPGSAIGTTV